MDLRVVLLLLLCAVGKWHAAAAEPCSREASMRLVDGPSSNCGRVEVCHDGVWGTVCDDSFDSRDADVVCRTVGGFEEHLSRHLRAYFGEGTGPIWLDNLSCAWSFTNITQCTPLNWGRHDCEHDEDVGVCCKKVPAPKPPHLPVRLVASCGHRVPYPKCPDTFHPHGVPSISGILEVQVNGGWGRIGAVDWNSAAATALCGEMGYPLATALTDETIGLESGSGTGFLAPLSTSNSMTYLHGLECTGKERELLSCFFSALGPQANPMGRVAAVNCSCKPYLPPENSMLRLKGGVWPWQGRVEVFKDESWATGVWRQSSLVAGRARHWGLFISPIASAPGRKSIS
ncbi:Lysyl oxidase homolog 2 [Geodia barretti]|uniref:Lysyl oxidase homolog 2 n=1 Tax=Geodia barretti TaxID=519541 RepID=A0AA35SS24_GEOBA|nr:Lysyl oxidase homolog 2 [Geodia barretti]